MFGRRARFFRTNLREKLRQEVLVDARQEVVSLGGERKNSNSVIVFKFVTLCIKALLGLFLSIILGPISLLRPIEIWLMKLGPDKASHFIEGIENHLRRSHLQWGKKSTNIVIWPQKFPNEALAKLYRRVVYILGPRQKFLATVLPFVIWRVDRHKHTANSSLIESQIRLNRKATSVSFSEIECSEGRRLEAQLNLSKFNAFVMLGFTSRAYRASVDKKFHPNDDLFSAISDQSNFVKVVERLTCENIGVVRQGLNVEDDSALSKAGLLVPNYEKFASGFPDIWLAANCKFLLSACTGSWWFGLPFNKPAVITDLYAPNFLSGLKENLVIFQLPWNLAEERFENFAWMSSNFRWCYSSTRLGTEYITIKNSPEQIVDVVDEQIARLDGTWVETDEDEELQKRFQRFVWGKDADPAYLPRVGAKFLREHQHLLPD